MFELKQVRFKEVLSIDHLKLQNNKISCIVGPSGSGKTTLLRLLNKMICPDEGKIYFQGRDLDQLNAVQHRRQATMLSQNPIMYPGTIKDNLLMGLKFQEKPMPDEDQMYETLKAVSLKKTLDQPVNELSGGEKQRLALGRILLMQPLVYLLDEPSASLDEATEDFIIHSIVAEAKKQSKALIMVTHSNAVAKKYADHLITMAEGKILKEQANS